MFLYQILKKSTKFLPKTQWVILYIACPYTVKQTCYVSFARILTLITHNTSLHDVQRYVKLFNNGIFTSRRYYTRIKMINLVYLQILYFN